MREAKTNIQPQGITLSNKTKTKGSKMQINKLMVNVLTDVQSKLKVLKERVAECDTSTIEKTMSDFMDENEKYMERVGNVISKRWFSKKA